MKKINTPRFMANFQRSFAAAFWVAVLTAACLLIGRDVISTPIVALLFLVPITWFTIRRGQIPGVSAAISATLLFDYYFIPPYGTFNIGSLEGWLILAIFLLVSVVVVGQIQGMLSEARRNEHEAISMFELVASLSTLHSRETIARALARGIQQDFQARQVTVIFYKTDQTPFLKVISPEDSNLVEKPSRAWVLDANRELIGEISVWKGDLPLPSEKSWMLQSFIRQTALALDRVANYA